MTYRKFVIASLFIVCGAVVGPSTASAEPREIPKEPQNLQVAVYEDLIPPDVIMPLEILPEPVLSFGEIFLQVALSQEGIPQDCTDLIQNSLAELGVVARRDQGGMDYGVQQLSVFGTQIDPSEARPGDIAITGPDNGGHIWVILDPVTGDGVHGGWNGMTVVGNHGIAISSHAVYRLNG